MKTTPTLGLKLYDVSTRVGNIEAAATTQVTVSGLATMKQNASKYVKGA